MSRASSNAWRSRKWKERDPEFLRKQKNHQLRVKFGITLDEYERLLVKQKGRCAICRRKPFIVRGGRVKGLAVDHCHDTKRVRGLLCDKCNRGIGMFGDDPAMLTNALRYLLMANRPENTAA